MSVSIQTGNVAKVQSGNRVLISAPGPQGPPGTGGGGTPGGTDTQVQFNDSSSFGGDAGLTYNKTTDTLTATNLTVSGLSTLAHIHGSIAGNLYVHVKNTSGGTLAKGTPVYATGSVGASGRIEVAAADYTNAAKMPAIGILDAALGVDAGGNAVVVGEVTALATDSYAINQELFVGTNGLLGALPATGQAQSIAVVSRVHASTGIIVVNAQARLNAALTALANNNGASLTGIPLTTGVTGTLPVANGGVHPLVTTGDNGSGYGRIGLWDDDAGDFIYFQAGAAKFLFPDIQATSFSGDGSGLTSLNAGNISTGILGVARGGSGANTLAANAVLLGNGTSAVQTVAPGTSGNVLTSNGTTWTSQGAFSQFRLVDNFIGNIQPQARSSGTNANVSVGTALIANRPAAWLQTGTTATGYSQLIERNSGSPAAWVSGASSLDFSWAMLVGNLSDGTETYTVRAGLETNNFGSINDGVLFRYTHSVNSGNWICVTRRSGVETVTNTSTAPTTVSYTKFQILINSTGTSVSFLINGSVVATHTTNIPTSAGYSIGIIKSLGTTPRYLYVSPFQYVQTLNTPY